MFKLFLTTEAGFYVRDVTTTDFKKEMLDAYNSFDDNVRAEIEYIFIVKLHFEVSDKLLAEISLSNFAKGKDHGVWTDVTLIKANWIGFNPDKHVFVCHKCNGLLAGNAYHKRCGCISGWVRPYQKYIDKESLKTGL